MTEPNISNIQAKHELSGMSGLPVEPGQKKLLMELGTCPPCLGCLGILDNFARKFSSGKRDATHYTFSSDLIINSDNPDNPDKYIEILEKVKSVPQTQPRQTRTRRVRADQQTFHVRDASGERL
jgi:hypothetical protein